MPELLNWLQPALFFLIGALILLRFLREALAKKHTVRAAVTHLETAVAKHITRYGSGERARYAAEFKTEDGVVSFLVSPFVYDALREGESGTLTYRGSKFLSFE